MNFITTQLELNKFCASVERCAYITVDTEFIRDKTYFPKLCLIQIAGGDMAAVIDPLSEDINLEPVFKLLQSEKTVKVFHACRQDIEIFFLLSGKIPKNVFDTQIAASMCGYGESVSYETLVNKIIGQELDKSSRFTDWAVRPLSERQLSYALSDVTYLQKIYEYLRLQVEDMGRSDWVKEEHDQIYDSDIYQINPDEAWKRLRYGTMRPKNIAVLKELAKWREIEARSKNVPRGRIMKDESLVELALTLPRKPSELTRMRSVDKNMPHGKFDAVFSCIEKALSLPQSEWPQQGRSRKPSENIVSMVAILQLLLKVKSDVCGIAAPIIAAREDLETLALGKADTQVLNGWRYDVFGREAQLLIEGKLKLYLNGKTKKIVFEEVEETSL